MFPSLPAPLHPSDSHFCSRNSFHAIFYTAAYGMDLRALQRIRTSQAIAAAETTAQPTSTPQFPFLFQRVGKCILILLFISPQKSISHILFYYKVQSSDEIGKGIAPPASSRVAPAAAAAAPSLPNNDEDSDDSAQQQKTDKESDATESGHGSVTRIHAEMYLRAYHHQTKPENPLYRTSQSVIGARPPSLATVVTERHAIPQTFSTSFGNILYSDQVRFGGLGN